MDRTSALTPDNFVFASHVWGPLEPLHWVNECSGIIGQESDLLLLLCLLYLLESHFPLIFSALEVVTVTLQDKLGSEMPFLPDKKPFRYQSLTI